MYFDHSFCFYQMYLFQKIINMAKRNCTFNNDWLIEFEWVEKSSSARTSYCKLCHHTFDISYMGRSALIQKGRSIKIRKFLENLFRYHFLRKRKAMLSVLLCQIQIKTNAHHAHLQMCNIRSSVPCPLLS